jgi:hypothetical protein
MAVVLNVSSMLTEEAKLQQTSCSAQEEQEMRLVDGVAKGRASEG